MHHGQFNLRRLVQTIPVPIGVTLIGVSLPVFGVHIIAIDLLTDGRYAFLDPRVRL